MQVIPVPPIDAGTLTFVGDLLSMWTHAECRTAHIVRSTEHPSELYITYGYRTRAIGQFFNLHKRTVTDGRRINLDGLRLAAAQAKLVYPFATSAMYSLRTTTLDCDVKYLQKNNVTVLMCRSTWHIVTHGPVSVPVLYRGTRGAAYYSDILETPKFDTHPRSVAVPARDITHEFMARRLQFNHGRLFCCHTASSAGACQQTYMDPAGYEAVSVINPGDVKPTPVFITKYRIYDFAVSPDGQLLVVCVGNSERQEKDIHLFELDVAGLVRLERACFDVRGTRCCFTPDGLTFALYALGEIRIIDVE